MNRNNAFFLAAVGIAVQIPTSIEAIHDPMLRLLAQIAAALTLLYAAGKTDLSRVGSIRPGPPSAADLADKEPDTIPDRKH